jgi:N-acetylmuramoyl-L-alanine amidase
MNPLAILAWAAGRIGDALGFKGPTNLPYVSTNDIIAICVGHSRRGDRGATSAGGVSEWAYNQDLAQRLKWKLESLGVHCFVLSQYDADSYGSAMRWVSGEVEKRHATLAVELHFNAATGTAQGHEWLYWGTSKQSKILADALCSEFAVRFPARKNRGSKAKTAGDRGAEFLKLTHCPAVICEPFFGDNPDEWKFATTHTDEIADAIAQGIMRYVQPAAVT